MKVQCDWCLKKWIKDKELPQCRLKFHTPAWGWMWTENKYKLCGSCRELLHGRFKYIR